LRRPAGSRSKRLNRKILDGESARQNPSDPSDYDAESIKVLKGLDAVRKRPDVYRRHDDGSGLHHMVYEAVDNAIDEALAGYAKQVLVTLNPDGSCTCATTAAASRPTSQGRRRVGGRGHHDRAARRREIRPESYKCRRPARRRHLGGQRLSSWLKLTSGATARSISSSSATAHGGAAVGSGRRARQARPRGDFLASKKTFTMTEFRFRDPGAPARELAFLNSGVTIVLSDMRHPVEKREEMRYEGGVEAFVKYSIATNRRRCRRRS